MERLDSLRNAVIDYVNSCSSTALLLRVIQVLEGPEESVSEPQKQRQRKSTNDRWPITDTMMFIIKRDNGTPGTLDEIVECLRTEFKIKVHHNPEEAEKELLQRINKNRRLYKEWDGGRWSPADYKWGPRLATA